MTLKHPTELIQSLWRWRQ